MHIDEAFPQVLTSLWGVEIRDTVVTTWGLMILIIGLAALSMRRLSEPPGSVQLLAELIIEQTRRLITSSTPDVPFERFLPFVGTLAVFLVFANTASIVPGVGAPTKDLSTTAALAILVFFAVHYFAIRMLGPRKYLSGYLRPHWLLLPFNIIGEITRTIALALRLFGNILSGELVVAVLVVVAGLLVPVPLQILGLLIGLIQAYVFTLLAMVYIAAALQISHKEDAKL